MSLRLVPIDLATARRFIGEHHRHNLPPVGWKWGVGVHDGTELAGVAIASRPVGRGMDDGYTLEVIRTCTNGEKNANSMLYGAIARAAKALGYRRVITYTLAEEPGTSLRAVGWVPDAELPAREEAWVRNDGGRYQTDLFGAERRPPGPKVRWLKEVA